MRKLRGLVFFFSLSTFLTTLSFAQTASNDLDYDAPLEKPSEEASNDDVDQVSPPESNSTPEKIETENTNESGSDDGNDPNIDPSKKTNSDDANEEPPSENDSPSEESSTESTNETNPESDNVSPIDPSEKTKGNDANAAETDSPIEEASTEGAEKTDTEEYIDEAILAKKTLSKNSTSAEPPTEESNRTASKKENTMSPQSPKKKRDSTSEDTAAKEDSPKKKPPTENSSQETSPQSEESKAPLPSEGNGEAASGNSTNETSEASANGSAPTAEESAAEEAEETTDPIPETTEAPETPFSKESLDVTPEEAEGLNDDELQQLQMEKIKQYNEELDRELSPEEKQRVEEQRNEAIELDNSNTIYGASETCENYENLTTPRCSQAISSNRPDLLKKILLDPGHLGGEGTKDNRDDEFPSGARFREGIGAMATSLRIKKILKECFNYPGEMLPMTRHNLYHVVGGKPPKPKGDDEHPKNVKPQLGARGRYIKSVKPDLFISIHTNGSKKDNAQGVIAFTHKDQTSSEDNVLGDALLKSVGGVLRQDNLPGENRAATIGLKDKSQDDRRAFDGNIAVMSAAKSLNIPSVLMEGFFHDYAGGGDYDDARNKLHFSELLGTSDKKTASIEYYDTYHGNIQTLKYHPAHDWYAEGMVKGIMKYLCDKDPRLSESPEEQFMTEGINNQSDQYQNHI